jgi:Tol biopolymer transport system component
MGMRLVVLVVGLAFLGGAVDSAEATDPGSVGKIAFSNGDIFTMNPDGGQRVNLTSDFTGTPVAGASNCAPSWSPSGTQIAYLKFPATPGPLDYGSYQEPELVVANADGTSPRVLLGPNSLTQSLPAYLSCYKPAWSPDGTRIAYTGGPREYHSTFGKLFVINANGGPPIEISDGLGWDTAPAWSPDGTRIAFRSINRTGSPDGIYITSPVGGAPRYLAPGDDPNWSPDGTKLAVTRAFENPLGISKELWIINASDGSAIRDLGEGYSPSWSPDGSKIAFNTWWNHSTYNVFTVNPDGTGLTQLTTDGQSQQPDWQPLRCVMSSSTSGGASVAATCALHL